MTTGRALEAVTLFVDALWDVFREEGVNPLALYHRLLEKIKPEDETEVTTCLSGFRRFLVTYHETLVSNRMASIPADAVISYGTSKSVHLPIGAFIRKADTDTVAVIRQHLLTISAILEPNSTRFTEITDAVKRAQVDTTTKEGSFVHNIMMRTAEIDTSADGNPMTAITGLLSSGMLTDMVSSMTSGVQSGDMDPYALIGNMRGMLDSLLPPRPSGNSSNTVAVTVVESSSSNTNSNTIATTPSNPRVDDVE